MRVIESGRRYTLGERNGTYLIWDRKRRKDPYVHEWASNAESEFRWLEHEEGLARKRRRIRLAIAMVPLLGLLAIASPFAIERYERWRDDRAVVETVAGDGEAAPARYTNEVAGYSFAPPDGWSVSTLESDPSVTEATRADGGATLHVELAPSGGLAEVSDRLVPRLSASWTQVELEPLRERTLAAGDAVQVSGTAVDEDGTAIRFTSLVLDAGTERYALWVWVPAGWNVADVMPEVERALSSFEPRGGT